MILAAGAKFGIGFLTSGIYNTLLLDIPSINYFNARREYIEAFKGYKQNYMKLWAYRDVEDERGLRSYLQKIQSNELVACFGSTRKGIETIQSFRQLEQRLERIPQPA